MNKFLIYPYLENIFYVFTRPFENNLHVLPIEMN